MGAWEISWREMTFILAIGVIARALIIGTLGHKIRRYIKGRW